MHCWKHTVSIAKLDALQPDAPRILLATGKLIGKGIDYRPLDTRSAPNTQRQRAFASLKPKGMARLNELIAEGVTASTISRLEREGAIVRLARGLCQLPDASIDAHRTLAETAKLVPNDVICLTSALAYHELTDQIPAKVWIAIGPKDWRPRFRYPPARSAHFPNHYVQNGVERHVIDGVDVSIFRVAQTIADLFAIAALSVSTSRSKACGRHSENAVSCVALIEHPQELRP